MRHCWKDVLEDVEIGSDEYTRRMVDFPSGGTCMLPDGHDGPHRFTSDDKIMIHFGGKTDVSESVLPPEQRPTTE